MVCRRGARGRTRATATPARTVPSTQRHHALKLEAWGSRGILRGFCASERDARDVGESSQELHATIRALEEFEAVVVGRQRKMLALAQELENLRRRLQGLAPRPIPRA